MWDTGDPSPVGPGYPIDLLCADDLEALGMGTEGRKGIRGKGYL